MTSRWYFATASCIFPVFLGSLKKGLPKCKVAHFIRQSYLYGMGTNNNLYSKISKKYPLTYCYIKKGHTASFYYKKNNLIAYYTDSMEEGSLYFVPLYNYVKNDYDIILSPFEYYFLYHHDLCVVISPNRQVYKIVEGEIANLAKGTLLYDLGDVRVDYLFHSMPIANSFILVVTIKGNEMFIEVIDLIKGRKYSKKYPLEKILDSIISLLKGNNVVYEEIKNIKALGKLYFESSEIISHIDNSIDNLVFYDRCVVSISISFENTKTADKKTLKEALSIIAVYQSNEFTVELQINNKISVETPHYSQEIDFGFSTILISDKYKVEDKHDLSQSHLYSVIASAGEYHIISEPTVSYRNIVLYYKNKPNYIIFYEKFDMENLGDVLFIRASDKRLVLVNKDIFIKSRKTNKYYVQLDGSIIDIIDIKVVRGLIEDVINKNNNAKWICIDVTSIVKRVNLKDKLKKFIHTHYCSTVYFATFYSAYYVDYDKEELYSLVHFQCSERSEGNRPEHGKHKFYLFKCKIVHLLNDHTSFRLVQRFEFEVNKYPSKLFDMLRHNTISGDYSSILRLLYNKWNTSVAFVDLRVFEIYNKSDAYYDFMYNRSSIVTYSVDTSIVSDLHLVRCIKQVISRTA